MSRGGATKTKDTSERRCIATGDTAPKAGLLRFVVSPENVVTPDILERLPGRGIWCSADRAAVELVVKKNLAQPRPRSLCQMIWWARLKPCLRGALVI